MAHGAFIRHRSEEGNYLIEAIETTHTHRLDCMREIRNKKRILLLLKRETERRERGTCVTASVAWLCYTHVDYTPSAADIFQSRSDAIST